MVCPGPYAELRMRGLSSERKLSIIAALSRPDPKLCARCVALGAKEIGTGSALRAFAAANPLLAQVSRQDCLRYVGKSAPDRARRKSAFIEARGGKPLKGFSCLCRSMYTSLKRGANETRC